MVCWAGREAAIGHRPTARRTPGKTPAAWVKQSFCFPAQISVEEGKQIGAFRRQRRGTVELSNLESDCLPGGGVRVHELWDEEDEVAEREAVAGAKSTLCLRVIGVLVLVADVVEVDRCSANSVPGVPGDLEDHE